MDQRYREALALAERLHARPNLPARLRLDALRELGILRLIDGDDAGAIGAFSQALSRDPGFDLGPGDHPRRFVQALADARTAGPTASAVQVGSPVATVQDGLATFEVQVRSGADAADSVLVLWRPGRAGVFSPLILQGPPYLESAVPAVFRISAPVSAAPLEYYLEVRAPSGAVLAHEGSADAPLVLQRELALAVQTEPPRGETVPRASRPIRRRTDGGVPSWLWIAGGAVLLAGATVGAVVLAQPAPLRSGVWGDVELGR